MNNTPKVTTISSTTLQRAIGTVLKRVAKDREHIVVERDGFPVGVIIPIADYEFLTQGRKRQDKNRMS